MADIRFDDGILHVGGDANIRSIADIHAALLTALQKAEVIMLDLRHVTDVDLTFVQLIEAARRRSVERGGQIRLASPADGGLLNVLLRGGFLISADDGIFWLHTTEIQ